MYKPYFMKDVHDASAQNKFTVISTFAGGGGSSTGYRLAGGKLLCVNEFVPEAIATYHANYPDTPILSGDFRELKAEDFLNAAGISVGELDILDGSPPCMAFTENNGGGYKQWGKDKNYSDVTLTNAEDLFFDFLAMADQLKPKVIIAENVRGIGKSQHKHYFNRILNTMSDIGYVPTAKMLDASYFGVPQSRLRYFFVGIRKDIAAEKGINRMNIAKRVYPKENDTQTVVGDAIRDLMTDPQNILDGEYLESKMKTMSKYEWVKQFKGDKVDRPIKMSEIHPKGSFWNTTRLLWNYPCWTITQTGLTEGLQTHLHPEYDRGITLMESKRIMSLPDDYILTGKLNQQYERVGRMVAPLQMKALAENIYEKVLK